MFYERPKQFSLLYECRGYSILNNIYFCQIFQKVDNTKNPKTVQGEDLLQGCGTLRYMLSNIITQ